MIYRTQRNDYRSTYGWGHGPDDDHGGPTPADVIQSLGSDTGAELGDLADVVCLLDWLNDLTPILVERARINGPATWGEIGQALGISKQAAQQRFGAT